MERFSPTYTAVPKAMSHGTLIIHSAPSALRTHIDWAIKDALGISAQIQWRSQPNFAGTYRTENLPGAIYQAALQNFVAR